MRTKNPMQALSYLEIFIINEGFSPSLRQIAEGVSLPLTATYHAILELERLGLIRRQKGQARGIVLPRKTRSQMAA
jgi:DNA-binding IscR family transcriptional regulator